jgi:transcriptional regulator with XRE-family HTH domain
MPSLASFPSMMRRDRKREGMSVCRAAWLIGVSVREYREIEAGDRMPSREAYQRICSCTAGRKRSWVRGRRDGDCGLVRGPHVQQFELPARNRGLIVDHVVEVLPP